MALAALGLTVGANPAAATDWPMYGFNLQRTGENPFETIITPSTVAGLHLLWSFDLGAVTMVWQRNLGSQQTSCHDIPDGIFGVSGSPFLDRANNRMFVVGGDG